MAEQICRAATRTPPYIAPLRERLFAACGLGISREDLYLPWRQARSVDDMARWWRDRQSELADEMARAVYGYEGEKTEREIDELRERT
jgi:hypothetical protein